MKLEKADIHHGDRFYEQIGAFSRWLVARGLRVHIPKRGPIYFTRKAPPCPTTTGSNSQVKKADS